MRSESSLEKSFARRLKACGLTSLKLNVTGQRGWVDRLVILPNGRVVFVELKTKRGKLSALQKHNHLLLVKLGHIVYTVDDVQVAMDLINRHTVNKGLSYDDIPW